MTCMSSEFPGDAGRVRSQSRSPPLPHRPPPTHTGALGTRGLFFTQEGR